MFTLTPIGHVRSPLTDRAHAPRQGGEGAPEAVLEIAPAYAEGVRDLRAGDDILVLTWLHRGDRAVLAVHPRDDPAAPPRGVFSTRSSDRPNPVGIHRARIVAVEDGPRIRVDAIEAVDGTPVIDIKPVLDRVLER